MYFYLAMVGFEPTPTSIAVPSNTETTGNAEKSSINLGHDNSFFKERSGREGMTVVSVLLGAAVEVGVGSNPTIAK